MVFDRDEASDVAQREQFNLSLRWVSEDYKISEDLIGFFCLPDATLICLSQL